MHLWINVKLFFSEQVDGLALFAASLRYWIALNEICPHVFVSTHFHSIIQYNLLPKSHIVTYQVSENNYKEKFSVLIFCRPWMLVAGILDFERKVIFSKILKIKRCFTCDSLNLARHIKVTILAKETLISVNIMKTEKERSNNHYNKKR